MNSMPEHFITENIDLWAGAIKRKSGVGRGKGGSKKIELYGVKKLRELILEMAVRGLLVPQDAGDEPASVLLEKIATEKAGLIKEKKIKKQALIQPIEDEEKPFNLPDGWEMTRLSALLPEFQNGASSRGDKQGKDTIVVRLADISDWKISLNESRSLVIKESSVEKYSLSENDVLIIRVNGSSNIVGRFIFCEQDFDAIYCDHFIRMRFPIEVFVSQYLSLLGSSLLVRNRIEDMFVSTAGQKTVNQKHISSLVLTLPPTNEQYRIVAKVDELMALCAQLEQQTEANISAHQTLVETLLAAITRSDSSTNSAESVELLFANFDSLFTTEESIDQLKQAILQLAVMGKLVPQDASDEPASVLLEKIAAEKEKLVKEKKIKKQKALPPIGDEEKPFELPVGWEWCRFDDVVNVQSGITKGRKLADRETITVPYLSVANVQRSYLDLDVLKEIDIPVEEQEKFQVLNGDLLITEGGDWDKVGRTAIWCDERPYVAHQNHVFRASVFLPIQDERWLEKYLNSRFSRDYFAGSSKQTTNLASINKTQLRGCLIAIPPVGEKEKIVSKVDELIAVCDKLKAQLNTAQTTKLHLADAVTEQAVA